MMDQVIPAYGEPLEKRNIDYLSNIVTKAQQLGRELRQLLARAELYGTAAERASAETLLMHEIAANTAFYGLLISDDAEARSLQQLKETLSALDPHRRELVYRIRMELGLELAAERVATGGRQR